MSLDIETLHRWNKDFSKKLVRNAVVTTGVHNVVVDTNKYNKVQHLFTHSLKIKNIKATNQGNSGRCWMFAGLNMFRHILIKALGVKNFEFSETYLFFWDKLERSNSYLQWFINNDVDHTSRYYDHMKEHFITDGGYWTTFASLVEKYGLVPKKMMPETAHSGDSQQLNEYLHRLIDKAVISIMEEKNYDKKIVIKDKTIKNVFDLLVTFLGNPPQSFEWYYTNEDTNETFQVEKMTPYMFTKISTGGLDIRDFTVLISSSNLPYNKKIGIECTKFLHESKGFWGINITMYQLKKCVLNSINAGFPVWFAGDVSKGFDYYNSSLDESVFDYSSLYNTDIKVKQKDRVKYKLVSGNHAMVFCGVNINHKDEPTEWQVENSWGYFNEEIPGLDGFLTASDDWFNRNVVQVVVHKSFLSRSAKQILNKDIMVLKPWHGEAPALVSGNFKPPLNYIGMLSKKHTS